VSRVGVAVCGLGRIGLRHAENLAGRVPGARLARVHDARPEVAEAVAGRLGVPWSRAFEDLIGDRQVRAVVLATPPATHLELVERAAAAGLDVFCEKPLAPSVEEAERAGAVAAAAGVRLQIGFQMRFDPDLRALRDRVAHGAVGPVSLLRASLRDAAPPPLAYLLESPGFLHDGAVHLMDLARWLGGEVVEVSAFAGEPLHPDVRAAEDVDLTVCVLRFASGALGVLDNARESGYGFETGVEVLGPRGAVRAARAGATSVATLDADGVHGDHVADFLERFAAAYELELAAFARGTADRAAPVPGAADAVAAARLCDAAAASLRAGTPVALADGVLPGGGR